MGNRLTLFIGAALIAASLLVSALAFPGLPEMVASHWNAAGEADGTMPRAAAAFLLPVVTALLFALILWLPRIDPLRANIDRFRPQYNLVALVFCGFLLYLHLWTLAWNLGRQIPVGVALAPATGILFFLFGAAMKKAKPNWIFGIRTPWTLSSPVVWERAHAAGSVVFKVCGVLAALGVLFPEFAIARVLLLTVLAAVVLVVYSYCPNTRLKNGSP
jgi:uncharacterized membrane protein